MALDLSAFRTAYDAVIEHTLPILWGEHTFVILLGVGLLFTIWTKFIQYRALSHGIDVVRGRYDDRHDPGAINHFQALSAALSATVGLGNIGGVALAIGIGGPGALFWMWIVAIMGMAIKSVEVTLAMLHRDTSDPDNPHGGAMWVVTRGWGDRVGGPVRTIAWIVGAIFCVTLLISTMTGGNMFQAWNVANITNEYFGVPQIASGILLAGLVGMVIIGGIKRIGAVAGRLVPLMCGLYILAAFVVLIVEAANVPALLLAIVRDAFSPTEAGGAFLGATAYYGFTTAMKRALFSNEAGQGSSPIAHSAAKTNEPVREGVVAGLEPFIDTCLVCTLTALVILATGTWNREAVGEYGAPITITQVPVSGPDGNPVIDAETGEVQVCHVIDAPRMVSALPALPAPDSWLPGNRFFLLAEVDEADRRTGSRLIRIGGEIVRAEEGGPGLGAHRDDIAWARGDLIVRWSDPGRPATIVSTGVYRDFTGAALTGHAFDRAIPGLGKYLVTLACWLFALSTMISWSYYGEQGVIFLTGRRGVLPYKAVFCTLTVVATIPAFITSDTELGDLADLGTGCMLLANIPIIVLMAPQAMRAFRDYFGRLDRGEMKGHAAPPLVDVVEGRDVE